MEEPIRNLKRKFDIKQKYDMGDKVGEGTYGIVLRALSKATRKSVAIKKFKATKDGEGISLTAYREVMVRIVS
jgi:cyclin-dependent kinase 8/11